MSKQERIYDVSNPEVVYNNAMVMFDGFDNFELELSTRQNKKYMIRGDFSNGRWIHFGDVRYQDYTKHNDDERRRRFLTRNAHWNRKKFTPAYFSYHLLW